MNQTPSQIAEQYKTSANLDARIALHQRFSTNPYAWMRWVFDQFELSATAHVLELGCGPGKLWLDNADRIPEGWKLTLTDLSFGMLAQNRANLSHVPAQTGYACANAINLPFADATFDAVIANHMLYHVPNLDEALAGVRRVLKPGGMLYAATNGLDHLHELDELAAAFSPEWTPNSAMMLNFGLQSGPTLAHYFGQVELRSQANGLYVTEAEPLVAYILSSMRSGAFRERKDELLRHVEAELCAHGGALSITKSTGMFIARN